MQAIRSIIKEKRSKEKWPHFVILGGGKSGATSLDYYLDQHPDVFMSPVKEPNFFGYELSKYSDFKNDPEELEFYINSITSKKAYLELFKPSHPHQIRGEVSESYLYRKCAAKRLKHYIPDAKIIVVLRQPASRLYSRFLHLSRLGCLSGVRFEDCLDPDQNVWWSRNDLIKEGYIYQHLKNYFEIFDAQNIKVLFYEDLVCKPDRQMQTLFEFIGVDSSFQPNISVNLDSSSFFREQCSNSFFREAKGLMQWVRFVFPNTLHGELKGNYALTKSHATIRSLELHNQTLDPEIKRKVTRIYSDDIYNLSLLLNKDLSHWLV